MEQGDDGEIHTVVHSAGVVLAAGLAGVGALSDCMAALAAVSDSGHRGGGCVRAAARDFISAGEDLARAAQRLSGAREQQIPACGKHASLRLVPTKLWREKKARTPLPSQNPLRVGGMKC